MAASNTNATYMTPSTDPSLRSGGSVKPTLLTFHGSGSNSTVHTVQLARLGRLLKPHFDIITLEAPFPSAAGPGVLPFFEGCGPFKRWIPPHEKVTVDGIKRGEASGIMPQEVEALIKSTVAEVRSKGGRVVGVIGFSQGTRVVAGLLRGVEARRKVVLESGDEEDDEDWCDLAFGLSVCGSYPPPLVPPSIASLISSSHLSADKQREILEDKIQIPTLHVLGNQDEWQWAGHLLIDGSYQVEPGKSEVLNLDMGHHYPVPAEDSEQIRDWVVSTWERVCAEGKR